MAADLEKRMTIAEHLEELRVRVVRSLLAVGVGFAVAFLRLEDVMRFVRRPLDAVVAKFPPGSVQTIQTKAYGAFMASMLVAFCAGLVLAAPVILHQLWAFVAAGLYPHERRAVKFYALPGFALFLAGAALAYFFVMPLGLDFLVDWSLRKMGARSVLEVGSYVALVAFSMFVFGLAFQLPLVMVLLMRLGVVEPAFFRKYRRHAIVFVLVVAAILTPPDVLSQIVLGGCVLLLYEGAIFVGARVSRPRSREGPP